MEVLGSGLELAGTGSSKFIYTIPGEVSMDHTILLQEVHTKSNIQILSKQIEVKLLQF